MPAENLNHFTKEYKHIIQRGVIMNTNFFINCRWFTTPCKTVLNADEFIVEFLTSKHSIVAKVSDKCYFLSIDNISLSDIKCDFHFSRNYTTPKEFLSKLYDTFVSFLNTFISVKKYPVCKNDDEALDRILEVLAEEKSELNTNYDVLADEKFHQLTKTLIKSLFKAIGTVETCKIHFIISNNMVFFNYNGMQYKYYPSQCKVFKKCGRKYQRINWKYFAEENNPDGQKQKRGRSPPFFTPDIRSKNIDKFKIKE